MALPVQSDASELKSLISWYRCVHLGTSKTLDVLELNPARARREAALEFGCCETRIRVEGSVRNDAAELVDRDCFNRVA